MSDTEKQDEMKKNFGISSTSLMKKNSFKNINEEIRKYIENLTEAFQIIYSEKSFMLFIFYIEQKDSINNFFKNVLNQIILNALQEEIYNENIIELMSNFFYSIIKLLLINESNSYPELPKIVRKIISGEKEKSPYFLNSKGITFWQFNQKYYSDHIKNNEQKLDFKEGDEVEVLVENYKKEGIDRLLWMEGIIKKKENNIYYIIYNGEDEQNNEILYPIGFPTIRSRNKDNWNWRLNLKENDLIYAFQEIGNKGNWTVSKILERKEEEKYGIKKVKYKVGFRIYIDENRKSFLGEMAVEYFYHYSKKIQEFSYFQKNESETNEEFCISQVREELNDMILYNKDDNNNIIIGRLGTFSYNFATLLKKMEKENIFNEFLNLLNDDNLKSQEVIYTIYFIFYFSLNYLHKDFIKEKKEIFQKGYSRFLKIEKVDNDHINLIINFLEIIDKNSKEIDKKKLSKEETIKNVQEPKILSNDNNNIFKSNNISKLIQNTETILETISKNKKLDEKDNKLFMDCINKEEILIKIIDNIIEDKKQNLIELLIEKIKENKINPNENNEIYFDKAKNKFEICKIYFEIIVKLKEINLENNYFSKLLNLALNNKYDLQFELFELYIDNLKDDSYSLYCFKLLINFFKSESVKNNILISEQNFEVAKINNLNNYLSDKNKPLIKIFEENFKNYILKWKKNINITDDDKLYFEYNIKTRLNFLDILIDLYIQYNFVPLFKYILSSIFPEYKKYFYEYIKEFFDNNKNKIGNDIMLELYDLININDNEKIYSSEEAKIYIRLLYYKNKKIFDLNIVKDDDNNEYYEIKMNYEQNEEFIFDKFFNFLFKVSDEKTTRNIMDILLQICDDKKDIIYKISDKLDETDYTNQFDINIIKKCYELLKIFFIETEKDLNIGIKPHFSLLKNCIIKLPLEIINKEQKSQNNKIELFYGNTTLNEIKELLMKKYELNNEYIETYIKKGENKIMLDYTYNHKSLYEILIEEFNIINDISPINSSIYFIAKDEVPFLKGNELSPKLKNIIEQSFYNATNYTERMYPKHFSKFMNSNLKDLLRDKKDFITKEEIFEFYLEKIKSGKKNEITTDLEKFLDNKNLMKQLDNDLIDNKELFRYYLSDINEENYKNNFLNDFIQNYNNINPKIDYNLFFFLPTSEYYYNKCLEHRDDIYKKINNIFKEDKQVLLQLYYLIIIESFLQDIESIYIDIDDIFNKDNSQYLELSSLKYENFDKEQFITKKRAFIGKFIIENHYGNLIEYAINLIINGKYKNGEIYKECLIKSLKIIKAIYISLIEKKNNFEIKSNTKKEKNVYYFDYRNIHKIKESLNIKYNPGLKYSNLVKNLINCMTSINNNEKTQFYLSLYEECFELIILIISSKKENFSLLDKENKIEKENEKKLIKIIKKEILSNSIFATEKLTMSLNYILEEPYESEYIIFLYEIFLSNYSSINNKDIKHEINNDEYFQFFVEFIKFIYKDNNFKREDLIFKLIEFLINYTNKSNYEIFSEELFIKYIELFNNDLLNIEQIRKILFSFKLNNKSLISSIYDNIINAGSNNNETKNNEEFQIFDNFHLNYKTQNICKEFIISCFEKEKINENSIKELSKLFKEIDKSKFQKAINNQRRSCGYVGLKNLSSTCYMNSILQQLFMIHILKYAILGASNISEDNRILKELQILFNNLEFSGKEYYDPTNFCKTNIFNKKPIDVHVQQDCKEFYDSFCDELEKCFKESKYKYIINDALMGYMFNSIKCESCDYTSNQFESFYDLSLEVKGIFDLDDSLKHLIKEERIGDFYCSNCKRKVNIRKRITLSKLPNTLIFHLKRFTFHMQNLKIYTKFNYPFEINLKEYCTESFQEETNQIYPKKDDYYKFILKGVVQHSGSAGGGHYISFINVNREGVGNTLNNSNDLNKKNWVQFNDSIVTEFDVNNLLEETIGNNSKTAYLLIYERIKKSPIKIIKNINEFNINENQTNIINNNEKEIFNKKYDIYYKNSNIKEQDLYKLIFHNKINDKDEYFQYIPYYSINKEIPKDVFKSIKEKNNLLKNELLSSLYKKYPKEIEANIKRNNIFNSF